jgi:hypothetical protein
MPEMGKRSVGSLGTLAAGATGIVESGSDFVGSGAIKLTCAAIPIHHPPQLGARQQFASRKTGRPLSAS